MEPPSLGPIDRDRHNSVPPHNEQKRMPTPIGGTRVGIGLHEILPRATALFSGMEGCLSAQLQSTCRRHRAVSELTDSGSGRPRGGGRGRGHPAERRKGCGAHAIGNTFFTEAYADFSFLPLVPPDRLFWWRGFPAHTGIGNRGQCTGRSHNRNNRPVEPMARTESQRANSLFGAFAAYRGPTPPTHTEANVRLGGHRSWHRIFLHADARPCCPSLPKLP